MKYKIWQVARMDYYHPGKLIYLKNKIDRSKDMFISPEGKFMAIGDNEGERHEISCYVMEQADVYFELEVLEEK